MIKGRIICLAIIWLMSVSTTGAIADEGRFHEGPHVLSASGLLAHNEAFASGIPDDGEPGSCWYVTERGYVAAVEEDLLDRAIFWAGLGDADEFERFIESNPLVFPLRSGLRVRIDKFSFSDKVRIRPAGSSISVWTVREAIRSVVKAEGS